MQNNNKAKTLARLCAVTVLFTLIVIGKGAFTRLTDAGLGCPDWPGCYGFIGVPSGEVAEEVGRAFNAPVEPFKAWVEMIHRYLATGLGLLIIAILVLGLKWAPKDRSWPRKHLWFLLALVCLQGAFGAWTVTLKLWPKIVTLHLFGGFAVLTTLVLLTARFSRWHLPAQENVALRKLLPLGGITTAVLLFQIFLGGWTSTNYAALACPDLPKCQGQWLPPTDFKQGFDVLQEIGPNYLGGQMDNAARVAIHLSHRVGAIVAALVIGFFAFKLIRVGSGTGYARLGHAMLALLAVQWALGLSNVYFQLPLWVATAHNVGAALLLQSVVLSMYALVRIPVTETLDRRAYA